MGMTSYELADGDHPPLPEEVDVAVRYVGADMGEIRLCVGEACEFMTAGAARRVAAALTWAADESERLHGRLHEHPTTHETRPTTQAAPPPEGGGAVFGRGL
jgi:hypothetical protein